MAKKGYWGSVSVAAVFIISVVFSPVWANDLTDGLIAYWTFDDGDGTIAEDSIGGNDGTLANGPVWTDGQVGGALSFDGIDDYIATALVIDQTGSTDVTMSAWVYPTSLKEGIQQIISTDNGGHDWSLFIRNGKWQVFTGYYSMASEFNVDLNRWQHIAAVFDVDDMKIRFYKNGVISSVTSELFTDTSTNYLCIGDNPGWWHEYFEGKVDEVRIYSRALSSQEVRQLYKDGLHPYDKAGEDILDAIAEKLKAIEAIDAALEQKWAACEALDELIASGDYGDLTRGDIISARNRMHTAINHDQQSKELLEMSIEKLYDALDTLGYEFVPVPIAHWSFDEGKKTTAYDSIGDNHGVICGAQWTEGIVGDALSFDGVDDYVRIPDSNVFDFEVGGDFSISAWFKTQNAETQFIINFRQNDNNPHIEIYTIGAGGFGTHILPGNRRITGIIPVNDDVWHHVAITLDNDASSGYRLYLDGVLVGQRTCSTTLSDWDTITIGAQKSDGYGFYNGVIDEVMIFDIALSAEEVRRLYETGPNYR